MCRRRRRDACWERFAARLLETQNFAITQEVRLTGTEVDLLPLKTARVSVYSVGVQGLSIND